MYWGSHAEQGGILRVSVHLFSNYRQLGMTDKELLWALQVLTYQMSPDQPPFPSHKLIAKLMGVSEKTSKRCADSLVEKGLLIKRDRGRTANGWVASKAMDFQPLFDKIDRIAGEDLEQVERPSRSEKGPYGPYQTGHLGTPTCP